MIQDLKKFEKPPTEFVSLDLEESEFNYFANRIFDLAGISMSANKLSLVQSRLKSRVFALGLSTFKDYRRYLESLSQSDTEWEAFTNLLTTNKTDWFRENDHFHYLKDVFIPKWKQLGKDQLNIWCAASSTGEEPYTLALVCAAAGIKFHIKATDIDTKVLARAKSGVYAKQDLIQIPSEYHRYFAPGTQEIADWMKVKSDLKQHVSFERLNLNEVPYPSGKSFDLIFCRNVLIYFKPPMIAKVTTALFECAAPEAMLFIAHSESLQNVRTPWRYLAPSLYARGKYY